MQLFRSAADRNLYIRLNAERIDEFHQKVNRGAPNMGAVDAPYSSMWISNNQVEYDEKQGKLRFSMEQLLTLGPEDFLVLQQEHIREWGEKFKAL